MVPSTSTAADPYDGLLLVSFGGPESPDEVMPFLERVTAGRGIPRERLELVAAHYRARGGRSPINDLNRELMQALTSELATRGLDLPVVWGNRNSPPFLTDALHDALDRGLTRLVAVTTSAYSSYSSCRQYRENLADALAEVGPAADGLVIDKIRPYAVSPGVGAAWRDALVTSLHEVQESDPVALFVTHSVPVAMDDTSGPGDGEGNLYTDQHLRVMRTLVDEVATLSSRRCRAELVFCSRSGPPTQAWLEPDIGDRLRELANEGVREVLVVPIGFISDHMEVIQDLDTDAAAVAAEAGIRMVRVATPGRHPAFVAGLVDLVEERAAEARGELVVADSWFGGDLRPSVCEPGCCPNLRAARPALCGSD